MHTLYEFHILKDIYYHDTTQLKEIIRDLSDKIMDAAGKGASMGVKPYKEQEEKNGEAVQPET